ncbi:hypothetical protein Arub01_40930 [Actinomadura rubrobrunea]|uniref:DUF4229 domain-containing protein n=1 Tax=Actinomadura rubrobrunea TaxID=115335 RepID=A0A9W6PWQ2_9ACTN|nr:DUF4229 domain-containing protein [Actinomadura rubrobrunea]GLW65849.1 hypothetical protein Arub01_40930 [Actinomadura rubrobrunea]
MRPVLVYTAARLGIFLATAGVLWLTPLQKAPLFLLLGALLISGLISYVLLSGQRDAMSAAVVAALNERRRRFEEARAKEDT